MLRYSLKRGIIKHSMKRHERKKKRPGFNRPFVFIAKYVVGWFLRWAYNLKTKNTEVLKTLEPPYIILSNHLNTFDPFIISSIHPRHIFWVASDALFRNRYLRFLMKRLIGSISKSKAKSDFYTIKQITKIVREQKGIVGLFPEGRRSWDGQTLPLMYATAKLVRMLNIPVVCCVLEGGYHSLPRWSNERRKGQLTVVFQEPWMPEDIKGRSIEDIFQELTRRLSYDAYDYQKKNRIIFKSNQRAQYLEHVLYLCPQCHSMASLTSRGNTFFCTHCGYRVEVDSFGFFISDDKRHRFSTVAEWNTWQRDYMKEQFSKKAWRDDEVIFSDNDVIHLIGFRDKRMKRQGLAWIGFTPIGFYVKDEKGSHWYRFDELESLAVSMQRNVEFYIHDRLHRLRMPGPNRSAYKYLSAYECLVEVSDGLKDRNLK